MGRLCVKGAPGTTVGTVHTIVLSGRPTEVRETFRIGCRKLRIDDAKCSVRGRSSCTSNGHVDHGLNGQTEGRAWCGAGSFCDSAQQERGRRRWEEAFGTSCLTTPESHSRSTYRGVADHWKQAAVPVHAASASLDPTIVRESDWTQCEICYAALRLFIVTCCDS